MTPGFFSLFCFSEEAKYRYCHNIWDSSTKQGFSTDEAEISPFLCQDDVQNLSDEPTAMKETPVFKMSSQLKFQVPDVETSGDEPAMYEEDSVSTFRSHAQEKTHSTSAKVSVSFGNPIIIDKEAQAPTGRSPIPSTVHESGNEDDSVSRMSNSMTKFSILKDQFIDLETHVTDAIQKLRATETSARTRGFPDCILLKSGHIYESNG
jgi:hypothetical protein